MSEPVRPNRRGFRGALTIALLLGAVTVGASFAVIRPWAHRTPDARTPLPAVRQETGGARSAAPIPTDPAHKIAFASQATGRFHIHVINADGTGDTVLTFGTSDERHPSWSPDRSRIAFDRRLATTDPFGADGDIYVMQSDGSSSIQLTTGPGDKGDPAWSPDGSRVAFFATDPSTGRRRIALLRIDGGPQVDLSDPPDRCNDREPAWSPDGLQLVFVRRCGDQPSALYLQDLTASPAKGLVLLTQFGRTPDWSPDGSKILYTGIGAGGPFVYVINVDGTGKTRLTDRPLSGDPEWSPDGTHIVFARGDLAVVHLFVMNADGTGMRRLTTSTAADVTASW